MDTDSIIKYIYIIISLFFFFPKIRTKYYLTNNNINKIGGLRYTTDQPNFFSP
jgi:hypothetical protein